MAGKGEADSSKLEEEVKGEEGATWTAGRRGERETANHTDLPSLEPPTVGGSECSRSEMEGGAEGSHSNETVTGGRRKRSYGCYGRKATPTFTASCSERNEVEQHKLQKAISALDTAIAELELQPLPDSRLRRTPSPEIRLRDSDRRLRALMAERQRLTGELKSLVQQKLRKMRRDSDEAMSYLATQLQNCSKEQICEAVRALDLTQTRFKSYIDQLLAVVLETDPSLLGGMPRLQQNSGLRMELLRGASKGQLLDELREREKNSDSLQVYANLLVDRISDNAPELIPSLVQIQETAGMESDQVWEE